MNKEVFLPIEMSLRDSMRIYGKRLLGLLGLTGLGFILLVTPFITILGSFGVMIGIFSALLICAKIIQPDWMCRIIGRGYLIIGVLLVGLFYLLLANRFGTSFSIFAEAIIVAMLLQATAILLQKYLHPTRRAAARRSRPRGRLGPRENRSGQARLQVLQDRPAILHMSGETVVYRKAAKMAKYKRNTGKEWTKTNVKELKVLVNKNTPTRVIGLKLGRTEDAVRAKASQLGLSLKPTNQSPYNRKK